MNLVSSPLTRADRVAAEHAAPMVRAMEVGQHVMAAVLTVIGAVRAIADGTPVTAAAGAGIAILVWHTLGTILPARAGARRLVVWWLVGFAVVWIGAVVVSPEFIWVAFLLWLLAGHLLPVPWGLLFSGVTLTVVIVAPILHHGTTSYANVFGPLIGGIFAFAISRGYLQLLRDAAERERLVASLTRAQHEMAELQDELALAQRESGAVTERTRISRDIHDTVAQALSSIRLVAHAGASPSTDAGAARALEQVGALAADSLVDVRRIVADLAPVELEDGALAAALRRMLDRARAESGLQAELHVDASLPLLPTEVEVALLRTAQSALANVRLHAHAGRVVMSLIDDDRSVRLDIIDDGDGFDVASLEREAEGASASYGLRFMRARLRELGGGLDIESEPGEGTAISVHLPVRPDAAPGQPAPPAAASDDSHEEDR